MFRCSVTVLLPPLPEAWCINKGKYCTAFDTDMIYWLHVMQSKSTTSQSMALKNHFIVAALYSIFSGNTDVQVVSTSGSVYEDYVPIAGGFGLRASKLTSSCAYNYLACLAKTEMMYICRVVRAAWYWQKLTLRFFSTLRYILPYEKSRNFHQMTWIALYVMLHFKMISIYVSYELIHACLGPPRTSIPRLAYFHF